MICLVYYYWAFIVSYMVNLFS